MRIVRAAVLVLVALAACSRTPRVNVDPESGRVDVDVQRPGTGETWNAAIRGQGGMPGISGTAQIHVMDEMSHAMVSLTGAAAGGTHPWHVHEGQCGDNGPIVGPASAYPPLRPSAAGTASAEAHLSGVELNEAKRYHVNIHASPSDLGTIIACGQLDD